MVAYGGGFFRHITPKSTAPKESEKSLRRSPVCESRGLTSSAARVVAPYSQASHGGGVGVLEGFLMSITKGGSGGETKAVTPIPAYTKAQSSVPTPAP